MSTLLSPALIASTIGPMLPLAPEFHAGEKGPSKAAAEA